MNEVYFIGPQDWRLGRVKIGQTRAGVLNRLYALQTGSPFPLTIYGFVEDEGGLERALHETFETLRLHGEWFSLEYKLLDLVDQLAGVAFGQTRIPRTDFWDAIFSIVCSDDVPMRWQGQEVPYLCSANAAPMTMYTHDIAWAEYQKGGEQ